MRLAPFCVRPLAASILLLATAALFLPAAAEEPFYKGKTIHILLSAGVAGGYSEYGRTLARHWGDHIAGNPGFIVESMPGAAGLIAANHLYFRAPKDGLTVGLVHATLPLAPLLGIQGARFDAQKFNWIGSMDQADAMCTAWHDSPIRSWADMREKEFIVGSLGPGSMDIIPSLLNKLLGTRIKVIAGYGDGNAIFLAMEHGELDGRCSGQLTAIRSTHPDWLEQHKIVVPVVVAEKRIPDFPDSPTVMEIAQDDVIRQQFQLFLLKQSLDRPLLLPPGVPAERVAELRDAFDATVADSAFRADAAKQRLHLDPIRGTVLAEMLDRAYALPDAVIASARAMMGGGGGGEHE